MRVFDDLAVASITLDAVMAYAELSDDQSRMVIRAKVRLTSAANLLPEQVGLIEE